MTILQVGLRLNMDIKLLEQWIEENIQTELSKKNIASYPEILHNTLGKIESYENMLDFIKAYKELKIK